MKLSITNSWLRSVRPKARSQTFWDSTLPGFGVRVSPKGRVAFFVRYRWRGRRYQQALGSYTSALMRFETETGTSLLKARAAAAEILLGVGQGKNPRRAETITFGNLAERYLADMRTTERFRRNSGYQISKHMLPAWRDTPIGDIGPREVLEVLLLAKESAPRSTTFTRAILSSVFRYAVDRFLVEKSPVDRVKRLEKKSARRDRFLDEDEMRSLWRVLGRNRIDLCVKVLLLTGQRRREISGMLWSEIDGEWLNLPAERVKNGLPHRVYLAPQTLAVLDECRRRFDSPWVFPSFRLVGQPIKDVAAKRYFEASGVVDWKIHDLRRTVITGMSSLGIRDEWIGAVVNHSGRSVTAVHYNRYRFDSEKILVMEAWAKHVDGSATGRVLEFPGASRS